MPRHMILGLDERVFDALDRVAEQRRIPLHQLMQAILTDWVSQRDPALPGHYAQPYSANETRGERT